MPQPILVPMDGSPSARRALEHAALMQRASGAAVHLLHVPEPPPADEHLGAIVGVPPMAASEEPDETRGLRLLEEAWQALGNADGAIDYHIEYGEAETVIAEKASELNAQCIVMGSRGLGNLKSLFVGSVSKKVMDLAPCLVITLHAPQTDAE
ncbi:universal stress protein [Salinicola aestuarinus]|uniref:universal stress protein n=1 Tax=Salinicola aestuarinus TaxID=1949082 RepID=UPI0013002788|nr:universal stress protein [Salinicola aestuarinus]